MSDQLEGYNKSDAERQSHGNAPQRTEWDRLEEIGDLHYQASAFSSAIDYYQQLLDQKGSGSLPLERALAIQRKSIDATLNIGDLKRAEVLLGRACKLLEGTPELAAEERSRLKAPVLARQASWHMHRGAYREALRVAKHAFAILAVTDKHEEVANLQATMGACHQRLARQEKAKEFYLDALSTYRRIGNDLGTAAMYNNLAILAKNACLWQKALELMEKATALAKKHGATHLLSRLHLNQGIFLTKMNRLSEARVVLEKSLRLSRSLGDRARQSKCCLAFGRLEILVGRLARAEELVLEGKLLAEQERFQRESTIADEYLGDILLARGEVDKALFNYELGLKKSHELGGASDLTGELKRRAAEALLRLSRLEEAIQAGLEAIAICEECGEDYEIGFCHRTLGRAHAARGEWDLVDTHFRRGIALFQKQKLEAEWCGAVLAYYEVREASAGQAELLLLRRHLVAVQEAAASSLGDLLLCRIMESLAEVQMRLGQFDDALLTVYELERTAGGFEDPALQDSIVALRSRIENCLLGGIEPTGQHLQAISGIPGLFGRGDGSVPRNLSSVLQAGIEKVKADSGFIAMQWASSEGSALRIVARAGLTENLAEQLTRWFQQRHGDDDTASPSLFSRVSSGDPLVQAVPAVGRHSRSCVFMPITLHGRRFGLLFLGKDATGDPQQVFTRPDLDFLATYMGFLALFLHEKSKGRLLSAGAHIPSPIEGVASFENIITQNEKMLEMLALVRKVSPSDLTVLLTGETGTGKGLLAYAIHALSRRKGHKFLAINCAAIPETLLESELFGHVKGSFTGAYADKRGLLVEAEGGTVFLDEIGKTPLSMQGKLLQFLDTKVVRPVGSLVEQRSDVRIVCASKTDLHEMAKNGQFLEDLYYRLLDFPLNVPPLRERRDDIQLLVHHFVERFAQELDIETPICGSPFLEALNQHDWPGNVRELEKCLKRAIVLAQDDRVLRPEHLPATMGIRQPAGQGDQLIAPLRETLATVECRQITQALALTRGNKSEASRLLKISYPSLLKKIRFYGISLP